MDDYIIISRRERQSNVRQLPQYPNPRPRVPLGLIAGAILLALVPIIAVIAWLWLQWQALTISAPWFVEFIRYVIILLPLALGAWAASIGIAILWRRYGWRESIFADKQAAMMRATKQVAPNATSFTYHNAHQNTAAPMLALPEASPALVELPGALDLAAMDVRPTANRILLGIDEQGPVTVSVQDLCHVALLGSTGGGKSNLLRLILPQLQKIGASVILADPHFAPVDPENGDDWRPIADRLIQSPARSAVEIDQALSFMTDELARRLEKRNQNEPVGPPLFFAFDELPVICDLVRDAPERLGKLLREGRKVHLLTVGASQSLLIKDVRGSSTIRDQYRTAFYVGGDRKSAAAILDMQERDIDDGPLGKGIVLLRSKATAPARLVRVPLVSNESLYQLLSVAQSNVVAPTEPLDPANSRLTFGFRPATKTEPLPAISMPDVSQMLATPSAATSRSESGQNLSAEAARAAALFMAGKDPAEIVLEMRGIKSSQGATYQRALAEILILIRVGLVARASG